MKILSHYRGLVAIVMVGFASVPAISAPVTKPAQFAMCAVCHVTTKGAKSTMGPNLFGVGQRKAGTLAGYAYSPAMKKFGKAWDKATLTAYIQDPRKVVPGNKMAYAGQKDPKIAGALADYLLSLK